MKKYVYVFLLIIVLSIGLSGCNDKSYFVGKWKSVDYNDVLEFFSNGTVSHVNLDGEYQVNESVFKVYGEYEVEDNLLKIFYDITMETYTYEFSNNNRELTLQRVNTEYILRYTKMD